MIQAAFTSRFLSALKYLSRLCQHNLRFIKTRGFWLGIGLSFCNCPALSQVLDVVTINKNIVNQPVTIVGTSGGKMSAIEVTQTKNTGTGFCDGYVGSHPNHLLQLESFFEFLRLEVQSLADTTVVVKSSSGVWCNDDGETANPIIEGQWQPGLYQVWVGSYHGNTNDNYQLRITGR